MGHYNVVMLPGGQGIGGIMQTPSQAGAHPPAWGVYITVADTDATVARATDLGAKVVVPPEDIPNVGRFAWLRDPQGAVFAVIAYRMPECEG
jgi:predicted enzyme related to lactoylglutathione lyase